LADLVVVVAATLVIKDAQSFELRFGHFGAEVVKNRVLEECYVIGAPFKNVAHHHLINGLLVLRNSKQGNLFQVLSSEVLNDLLVFVMIDDFGSFTTR
jgi:hypothetical protein